MSTTTLSQRLRDLRIGLFPDIETVNAVLDECIAQAEREAQAGEHEKGRDPVSIALARNNAALMEWRGEVKANEPKTLTDDEIDRVTDDLGLGSRGRASFRAGLRYARDHYLKPSQATPVVTHLNMDPNASPETIEAVKDMVQKAYSYKPSQAIGEQTPVAWMRPHDKALVKDWIKNDREKTFQDFTIPLGILPISTEARDIDPSELVSIDKTMSIIKEEVTPYILEKTFPDELPRLWIILKNKLLEVLPFKE